MRDDLGGIYEARDKHGASLYRLFCLLDKNAPDHGLTNPALVLLCGGQKPEGAPMDQAAYTLACRYRDEYLASNPRRIASATVMRALLGLLGH